jgi:hypothetical protein
MQPLRCYYAVKISMLMPMEIKGQAINVIMDLVLASVKKEINVVSKYQTISLLGTI